MTSSLELLVEILVASVATYELVAQIVYHFRKFQCRIGRRNFSKELIEAILLSIASILILSIAFCRTYSKGTVSMRNGYLILYVKCVLYVVCLIILYSVLWLRQRPIYSAPEISHLSSNLNAFISKFLINLICVVGIVVLCVFLAVQKRQTRKYFINLLRISIMVGSILIHVPILCLMISPLYHHHSGNLQTDPQYVMLMKRVAFAALICLISDFASAVSAAYAVAELAFLLLYVNLAVNLTCVKLSSVQWKEHVLPCIGSRNPSTIEMQELRESRGQLDQESIADGIPIPASSLSSIT